MDRQQITSMLAFGAAVELLDCSSHRASIVHDVVLTISSMCTYCVSLPIRLFFSPQPFEYVQDQRRQREIKLDTPTLALSGMSASPGCFLSDVLAVRSRTRILVSKGLASITPVPRSISDCDAKSAAVHLRTLSTIRMLACNQATTLCKSWADLLRRHIITSVVACVDITSSLRSNVRSLNNRWTT